MNESHRDERVSGVRLVVSPYREFEQVVRDGEVSMAQYRTLLYLMGGARRAGELAAANAYRAHARTREERLANAFGPPA
jgi:hypothetical protein